MAAGIAADALHASRNEFDVTQQHGIPGARLRPALEPRLEDRQSRFLSRPPCRAGRDRNREVERPDYVAFPLPEGAATATTAAATCA